MSIYSQGFKGYEMAEDIHGQILLAKAQNIDSLHLKNMNFNFACCYDDEQAMQVKKMLDKNGIKALSLYIKDDVPAERAKALADIYQVQYLVTDNEEKKKELEKVISDYKIISE